MPESRRRSPRVRDRNDPENELIVALAALGLVVAVGLGFFGVLAVRGRRAPGAILAVLPTVPVLASVALVIMAFRAAFRAVSGEASVDVGQQMRVMVEASSESAHLLVYGALISGAAFGVATIALLGVTSSIDRAHVKAPRSKWWIVSLVVGLAGISAAIVQRQIDDAPMISAILVLPSLNIVALLSVLAARNGIVVRGWHDEREARPSSSSLLAAALTAAAGIVLVDLAARFFTESDVLGVLSGESVDRESKARILADGVAELRKLSMLAWVDGVIAFAIVLPALVASFGRGPDGRFRVLAVGGPAIGALGAVIALVGVHAWELRSLESLAGSNESASGVDLPITARENLDDASADLIVYADGTSSGSIPSYTGTVRIAAARRAKWSSVVNATRAALRARSAGDPPTMLALRVTRKMKRPPLRLDGYEIFLGPEEPAIRARIANPASRSVLFFRKDDDVDAVVTFLADAGPEPTIVMDLDPRRDE